MKMRILFLLTTFMFSCLINAQEKKGFLSAEDIALFYKQGYVIKRQCLNNLEINELNKRVTALIDQSLSLINDYQDLTFFFLGEDFELSEKVNGFRFITSKFNNPGSYRI